MLERGAGAVGTLVRERWRHEATRSHNRRALEAYKGAPHGVNIAKLLPQ
jgi:hypothetical protein